MLPLFSFSATEPRAVGPSLRFATTGGESPYSDAAVCSSSASSPLLLFGLLRLLFVYFFRFLCDGDVGGCSPSRRVFLIAVLLKMKRAHSTSPKSHKKGGRGGPGSSISCFSFVVSSFSCLRSSYVGVCTGLLFLLVLISQIAVGTPTEGDMARFRLRFRGCLHVPHQNRPTTTESPKIFAYLFV